MEVWKIIFLSKWLISRFHVNLPGCTHPPFYLPSLVRQQVAELTFVRINDLAAPIERLNLLMYRRHRNAAFRETLVKRNFQTCFLFQGCYVCTVSIYTYIITVCSFNLYVIRYIYIHLHLYLHIYIYIYVIICIYLLRLILEINYKQGKSAGRYMYLRLFFNILN